MYENQHGSIVLVLKQMRSSHVVHACANGIGKNSRAVIVDATGGVLLGGGVGYDAAAA
jgi:hypothetical protein